VRRQLLPAAILTVLAAAGCGRIERADNRKIWNRTKPERFALFADVEKLAVAPFMDPGVHDGLDAEKFANLVADELVSYKRFRVIYPRQVREAAAEHNRDPRRLADGRDERIDLDRSELDAVAAGRYAGADAVLVARIHDFKVYPPKRLAMTFRIYVAGQPHRSYKEIMRMTEAGVPAEIGGALREKFIWERQASYMADRKNTRLGMSFHAHKHERDRGFGHEIVYYSTEKFLTYVSAETCGRLYRDAQWYKSHSGKKVARKHGIDYRQLRAERARGSGFGPGAGDDGVGRGSSGGGWSAGRGAMHSSRGVSR
jgi:hypothetical protein